MSPELAWRMVLAGPACSPRNRNPRAPPGSDATLECNQKDFVPRTSAPHLPRQDHSSGEVCDLTMPAPTLKKTNYSNATMRCITQIFQLCGSFGAVPGRGYSCHAV